MTAAGQGGGPHGPEHDGRVVLPATERLGRKGRGPVLVSLFVAAAFLVGVVRPWDWLAPGGPVVDAPVGPTHATPDGAASTWPAASGAATMTPAPPPAPVIEATCAYPQTWRLATIQDWGGRTARVWAAARAVRAAGPDDPSIPFFAIASPTVTAFGWCAPVSGDERPPLAARAVLFRIEADGSARAIAFDRLEPAGPDALGELWVPVPQSVGRRPAWPAARYVIRLATENGSFERYLGVEVIRSHRDAETDGGEPPTTTP